VLFVVRAECKKIGTGGAVIVGIYSQGFS